MSIDEAIKATPYLATYTKMVTALSKEVRMGDIMMPTRGGRQVISMTGHRTRVRALSKEGSEAGSVAP